MKNLLIILLMVVSQIAIAQPSNDCGEDYLVIDQCGVNFSVSQATMALATEDDGCDVGGSCPITYVNGMGYENFDCNGSTGNSAGDDFNGSIENSLWWGFIPDESCDYNVTIAISNCCCKDKGSSNSAQYQIFDADAALPGGTIQNNLAYNTGVTGTFIETVSVTQGNIVYILLDGLNGTDCDIDVSITPSASCSGCILVMSDDDLIEFNLDVINNLTHIEVEQSDISNLTIQKSTNNRDWSDIDSDIYSTNGHSTTLLDENEDKGYYYYRVLKDGDVYSKTKSIYFVKIEKEAQIMYSMDGRVIWEKGTDKGFIKHSGMYIVINKDGTVEKKIK